MFGEELSGPEYSGRFIEEVKEMGIGYVTDSMVLSVSDDRVVTFVSPSLGFIRMKAGAVVLCTAAVREPAVRSTSPEHVQRAYIPREPRRDSSTSKAICPERESSSSAPETSD